MNTTMPSSTDHFATVVAALRTQPDVSTPEHNAGRKRFGAETLRVRDKIFAMHVDGQLVVKLPRQRVEALCTAEKAQPFVSGTGKPMREWAAVAVAHAADWVALTQEAYAFVGSVDRA